MSVIPLSHSEIKIFFFSFKQTNSLLYTQKLYFLFAYFLIKRRFSCFLLDRAEKWMPAGLGTGRVQYGRRRGASADRAERILAERP